VDEPETGAGSLAFLLDLQGVFCEEGTSNLEVVSCVLARAWQLSWLGQMKFAGALTGVIMRVDWRDGGCEVEIKGGGKQDARRGDGIGGAKEGMVRVLGRECGCQPL
jgi:hypothetical protein